MKRVRLPFAGGRGARRGRSLGLHTRAGTMLFLRKPLSLGGLTRKRPAPYAWRNIAATLGSGEAVPESRLNGWLLVLAAKKIPHLLFPSSSFPRLYVPPLHEGVALHEILSFELERPEPVPLPPSHGNVGAVLAFLCLFIFWHGLRWGWFPSLHLPVPPFPAYPEEWPVRFGLDVYRTRVLHEWWRTATALCLHADDGHLFGNMAFGLLFFIPLCRRAGAGSGILLAVLAGILGNTGNALTRSADVVSLGFSTAFFGAVGGLCALTALDVHSRRLKGAADSFVTVVRPLLAPLAAGLALLGFLGGGGEARTDYRAHIWGFGCGLFVGALLWRGEERLGGCPPGVRKAAEWGAAGCALFLLCLGWWWGLGLPR